MRIELDRKRLDLIQAMRFPLMVMVLFVHSLGFEYHQTINDQSGWGIYHFVSEMISHNLCGMAVSCFYLMSGILFFRGIDDTSFTWKWVFGKWKRRTHSLFIPYVIWNTLAVIIPYVVLLLYKHFGIQSEATIGWDVLQWVWSGPADYPLYFVRDLMVMTLLTPGLYMMIRYLKWPSMILLLTIFFLPSGVFGFSSFAVFFFGAGSWLSIWKVDFLDLCSRVRILSYVVAAVLLLLATALNSSSYHWLSIRCLYPAAIVAFINFMSTLIENEHTKSTLCSLSRPVFFIYAAHEIMILGWTKGLFLRLLGESLFGTWMRYFFVPLTVLVVCMALYKLLDSVMPKFLSIMCGNRKG